MRNLNGRPAQRRPQMEGMMLHRGGYEVTRQELDLIQLPPETDSYTPVSHYHLADKLLTISRDILTDFTLVGEKYALARQGQQMFAFLQFKNSETDMGLALGFRNSYDRSMSVGLAVGASVFVCDNLSLTGDIAIMRKHTKNIWTSLEDLAISTVYKSQKNFQKLVCDADKMKRFNMEDLDSFSLMGILFGKEIISPRQMTVVKDQWLKPDHPDFQPRNAWSFYNACTEALKTCPPVTIMEKHLQLHRAFETIIEVN